MKKDKFLTVYAILDDETQKYLTDLQKEILKQYPNGTQTMGIPFHITLGSFPIDMKEELLKKMSFIQKTTKSSRIELVGLSHFHHQVIFAKPTLTKELKSLHKAFEGNYADGFSWQPHVTLFCGREEEGKEVLKQFCFSKINSTLIGLELGEFFPPHIIGTMLFK
ncbi:MAG: 2'-5' RNA ligase family protein [Roseburia sp.]|nr:2'-5' RNA ligase family protein [Anaeroplasma bactoclasticum]MCM1195944.1 2'-5' RNA ligase family protein [Roseburia sp.]MCM1555914.1 2'-5' RNA ligase family protein [Anaeroplasma bactoclasticum]